MCFLNEPKAWLAALVETEAQERGTCFPQAGEGQPITTKAVHQLLRTAALKMEPGSLAALAPGIKGTQAIRPRREAGFGI